MKMKPEVYAYLETCINAALNEISDHILALVKQYRAEGLSEKRWRWDIYYTAKKLEDKRTGANIDTTGTIIRFNDFFRDLDDSHIDTALRKLVPSLESIITGEIASAT